MSEQQVQQQSECAEVSAEQYDWSVFTRKKHINASMQAIYDAWTKSGELEDWFLKTAGYTSGEGAARDAKENYQAGDKYRWTWYGYDGEELGEVLEANGRNKLAFTFADGCIVTVSITAKGTGHEVVLEQKGIPLTEDDKVNKHLGCSQGWTMYFMNLKSLLEGGLDLRTKNDAAS